MGAISDSFGPVWSGTAGARILSGVDSGFWGFIKPRQISQAELTDIKAFLRKLAAEGKKMWLVKQAEEALPRLFALRDWTPIQRVVLEQIHQSLVDARQRRSRLRRLMALELEQDPFLLRLWRLTGLSLITILGLVSTIGDIRRFSHSKKLVVYLGLNPSTCQSGKWEGGGALKRHGRGPIRALLVQASKRLLQVPNALQKWGLAVALRRGRNRAAVAVARKLTVAIWHALMGHPIGVIDSEQRLETKVNRLATILGVKTLHTLGYESKKHFTQRRIYELKSCP